MPLKLVRRPRSANAAKTVIKKEVRAAWEATAKETIDMLKEDVVDWVEPPEFSYKITLGRDTWTFLIKYDKRTRGGMHYKFVDEGTAERGGKGPAYPIVAKNADVLAFYTPDYPKTAAVSGGRPKTGQSTEGDQTLVLTEKVMHPGITPRKFTDSIRDKLKKRGPKGFKNITDAAMKRGLRKLRTNE